MWQVLYDYIVNFTSFSILCVRVCNVERMCKSLGMRLLQSLLNVVTHTQCVYIALG